MTRESVYQAVTARILEALAEGVAPWRKPWISGGPIQVRTGKPYRGINVFLLTVTSHVNGYSDPRWGTFKAIKEAAVKHARSQGRTIVEKKRGRQTVFLEVVDGKETMFMDGVRRGEKGTTIILWKPVPKTGVDEKGEEREGTFMLLNHYSVFNADQCTGLPEHVFGYEHDPITQAEALAAGYSGPDVSFGGDRAVYNSALDSVRCPELRQFKTPEAFYGTLYHELVHSTGHESRLDRLERTGFGTGPYAQEELVAEMGAAMLCGMVGIENLDESAAYVGGWLSRLQDDPQLVVKAAGQAQKAADLILGVTYEPDSQD